MGDDHAVPQKLVSSGVAARALGVHLRTFQRWIADGLIRPDYTTPGGHYRWDVDRLRRVVEQEAPEDEPE